jgi:hypothetical protein
MTNPRELYKQFVFESFDINKTASDLVVTYHYRLGEHHFDPTASIPLGEISNKYIDEVFLEELFFNFGVINAISYYKLSCAPEFIIKAGYLDENQKFFFRKLFFNGLGEFMFVNQLNFDFDSFMKIECIDAPEDRNTDRPPRERFHIGEDFHGNLIPVGGGKDSVVTLEALQPMHDDSYCLQFNRNLYPKDRAALNCIDEAGYRLDQIRNFNLSFDEHMLELNKQGFYNGHIPFSSTLAFAALIVAYLSNKAYIEVSNEASANESNVAGTNINHQYSKSYEFEKDFQNYAEYYLTNKIHYFSLLRCWNEYTICQKFLQFPQYLRVFRSCNAGSKENKWCGHCAKCLYVYIMLYPWVEKSTLQTIFGHDLLDDETLMDTFNGLVFPETIKPFECVGTKAEVCYTLDLAVQHQDPANLPKLLQQYQAHVYGKNVYTEDIPNYFNPEHSIPQEYLELLQSL